MRHVRLRRVERCRMMSDVLCGEKDAARKRFKKDARLDQSGHRLKFESTDSFNLRRHFAHLRNPILRQCQSSHAFEILRAGMYLMRGFECLPDCAPDLVFFRSVRRIGNRRARLIRESDLSDLIAACAILRITKTRMIRVELNNRISVRDPFIKVRRHDSHINMVEQQRLLCLCSHHVKTSLKPSLLESEKQKEPATRSSP